MKTRTSQNYEDNMTSVSVKERILDNPVIAAVKEDESLEAALKSECGVVFLLYGSLLNIDDIVEKIHAAGKAAVIHIDLLEGLTNREIAVDVLLKLAHPDGVISTRPALIRHAKHADLFTVQRAFIIDSMSEETLASQLDIGKPDFIEVLPGIMPGIISEIIAKTHTPVIAGGLIRDKSEVIAALKAGATAVSTSSRRIWEE